VIRAGTIDRRPRFFRSAIAADLVSAASQLFIIPPRKALFGGRFPTLDTPRVDSHLMSRGGTSLESGIRLNNDPIQAGDIDASVKSGSDRTLWRLRTMAGCVQGGKTKGTGHDYP
jgi:hypothetical protein